MDNVANSSWCSVGELAARCTQKGAISCQFLATEPFLVLCWGIGSQMYPIGRDQLPIRSHRTAREISARVTISHPNQRSDPDPSSRGSRRGHTGAPIPARWHTSPRRLNNPAGRRTTWHLQPPPPSDMSLRAPNVQESPVPRSDIRPKAFRTGIGSTLQPSA